MMARPKTTDDAQKFLSFYDSGAPRTQNPPQDAAQGLSASIWAPSTQQLDPTWPRTLDSFASRIPAEVGLQMQQKRQDEILSANYPIINREDVFGPAETTRPNNVGAVGDGRRKSDPIYDATHVEQLLRTLNLSSETAPHNNTPNPQPQHVEHLLRTLNPTKPDPHNATNSQLPHDEQLPRSLNITVKPDPHEASTHLPPPLSSLYLGPFPSSPDFSPASASSLLTPTDFSPPRAGDPKLPPSIYDYSPGQQPRSLLAAERRSSRSPLRDKDMLATQLRPYFDRIDNNAPPSNTFEPFTEPPTPPPNLAIHPIHQNPSQGPMSHLYSSRRVESNGSEYLLRPPPAPMDWRLTQIREPQPQSFQQHPSFQDQNQQPFDAPVHQDLRHFPNEKPPMEFDFSRSPFHEPSHRQPFGNHNQSPFRSYHSQHEPINFLSLLHPSSSPPYDVFVLRIIKSSDQQASIFLQQKLKVASNEERAKIVDAICARGFDMMAHRFGNWAVQRCLEAASTAEERRKIVLCMKGHVVELATNCYGCHVLQKALDCEEDIRLLIVSELLLGDPSQTLVNKHASHVWSKIMELSWTPPAPPIFAYVNKSLKGKWASLACHETGSLVVQHAFENLEEDAKDGIVDELLNQGSAVFTEVTKNQWGSYCIQHILEHGSAKNKQMTLDLLLDGLLEYATNEQGSKSVTKALKEGGKETLDKVIKRMCEPAKGARRAMIVDLALSVTGSQLIASVLPSADKDQRALLYECIRGHIVTLRGCKTGSKVIWLFDRMRAYYGY